MRSLGVSFSNIWSAYTVFSTVLVRLARDTCVARLPHLCCFCGTLVLLVSLASDSKCLSDVGGTGLVVSEKRPSQNRNFHFKTASWYGELPLLV